MNLPEHFEVVANQRVMKFIHFTFYKIHKFRIADAGRMAWPTMTGKAVWAATVVEHVLNRPLVGCAALSDHSFYVPVAAGVLLIF